LARRGLRESWIAEDTKNVPPPLKPLHPDSALNKAKLETMEKLSTETIGQSLLPGSPHSLKARPDGTILDGHHRVEVLRKRGVDVDRLPREVILREEPDEAES
jgi:hypothetical protein